MENQATSVCFVAQELSALFKNGGAGTTTQGFAEALVTAGHDITVLYVGYADLSDDTVRQKVDAFWESGISLHFIQEDTLYPQYQVSHSHLSYAVFCWLRERKFDFVHFNDFDGLAFFSVQAKRCGLALQQTYINVFIHGPLRWALDITEEFFDEKRLLVDYLERRSIEMADSAMSPSRYIEGYLVNEGLKMPVDHVIQRGVQPRLEHEAVTRIASENLQRVREIVFFGRHEVRKGFLLFIDAALILLAKHKNLRVTFLGKSSQVYGTPSKNYAEFRLKNYIKQVKFYSPEERADLRDYLIKPGVLAVIPSLDENLPNTVFESLLWNIEFIASNVGGIPEMLAAGAVTRLFEPNVRDLVQKVELALVVPLPAARLAYDPESERQNFVDWHSIGRKCSVDQREHSNPRVTVCLIHYDRPAMLKSCLHSLLDQDYENIEIIIVDDGSPSTQAQAELKRIEAARLSRPVRVIRTPDIGLGAARNAAAKFATGEYLVFIDDDNIACSNMVSVLVQAAEHSGAPIITCLAFAFSGLNKPSDWTKRPPDYLPIGSAVALGLFRNCFGDANALWNADLFRHLGGFLETRAASEDWELFARACLSGAEINVVPQQIFWYRQHEASLTGRPYSKWKVYTQIADLYAKFPKNDTLKLILRASQRHISFASSPPSAVYPSSLSSTSSSEIRLSSELTEISGVPWLADFVTQFPLTSSEANVLAGSSDVGEVVFEHDEWKDVTVHLMTPIDLAGASFRLISVLECTDTVDLRISFITEEEVNENDASVIGENLQNVLEIWRRFEPGTTCVYFSAQDCVVLRGVPDLERVTKILVGGAPGAVRARFALTALRAEKSWTVLW